MLHEQPGWVDHCSCMPRGSGDLLHRQQADFLNIPRSSAAVLHSNSPVLQDPFVSPSSTCFLHAAPLMRRCAAPPLRCAAAAPCLDFLPATRDFFSVAPNAHWFSSRARFLTPAYRLDSRPARASKSAPDAPLPPFLVHPLSDPCAGRSPSPPPSGCCAQRASSAAATTSSKRACTEAAASGNGDSSLASSM